MKLHLFQQITELNHSFDELIAGLAKLESVPFFQCELIQHARSDVEIARVYANREFFDNFEKIVEDDVDGLTVFDANSVNGSRTRTTSTSKSNPQRSVGSARDFLHVLSSFPIGPVRPRPLRRGTGHAENLDCGEETPDATTIEGSAPMKKSLLPSAAVRKFVPGRRYGGRQGKVVEWVEHSFEKGLLYIHVLFTDKTELFGRIATRMTSEESDLADWTSGDFKQSRVFVRNERDRSM
jgi:hypothetical protein